MNIKTTVALIVLVGAGAGTWVWYGVRQPIEAAPSPSLDFLKTTLKPEKLSRIEVTRKVKRLEPPYRAAASVGLALSPLGDAPFLAAMANVSHVATLVVLEKAGNEWALPGNWQIRPQETAQFLDVLTKLHSRYAPIPIGDKASMESLSVYGLNDEALTIRISLDGATHVLRFGEEHKDSNRFTRSTFLRLDDQSEVIQLGPGVYQSLAQSTDHFRQRRLFPKESVAKSDTETEKVDQLAASAVEVESALEKFTLTRKDKEWLLQGAFRKKDKSDKDWSRVCSEDRLDEAGRNALLRVFPDLWAERFVEDKTAEECGLKEPDYRVSVTKSNGAAIKLLIGKVSATKERVEMKKGPPGMPPSVIIEEWRFAKLENNGQLFEIKTEKLRDLAPRIDRLRDPRLADFKSRDVKRIEVRHDNKEIVLARVKDGEGDKAKETWRFEKPIQQTADSDTVDDLIKTLAEQRAREIHDDVDIKSVGLDKPRVRIKVTVEEVDKDAKDKNDKDDKDARRKPRDVVYHLGVKEKQDGKTYVRVDSWPRVNEVDEELWKLATRTDLAYRQRELWRVESNAIKRITIQADGSPYLLDSTDKGWKLGEPINADVAAKDVESLADELAVLKAERFEAVGVKDFAPFGLAKPELRVRVNTKDDKAHAIEIGKRTDKGDSRFARLEGADTVFVLGEKLVGAIRRDPYDFFEKNLWALNPAAIERIRFKGAKGEDLFALESKKGAWQIVNAPVPPFGVDEKSAFAALMPLVKLRAVKFAEFGSKIDWIKYGLDKPKTTVAVTLTSEELKKPTEHVILLGNDAPDGGVYARVDGQERVAIIDIDTAKALRRTHMDFADRNLLRFDAERVMLIERKKKGADFEIARQDDAYVLIKPGPRDADTLTVFDLLRRASQLEAVRIVSLAEKDLKPFGLDAPDAVITFHIESFDGSTKKHVIKLGSQTAKDSDERFAMIDERPMVVVLSRELSRLVSAPILFYADRNLASFANVDWLELTRGERKDVFTRTDKGWRLKQPIDAGADAVVIDDMIRSLQRLRADEIVAHADKGTDLKKYGLDQPLLQWRLKGGDTEHLHLIVGAAENEQPGARRFAKLANKAAIFLLSNKISAKLQAECADRTAWPAFKSADVGKLTITQRDKSFVLTFADKKWQLAGDAKAKVNEPEVLDTLVTLQSLTAARWVAHAKADLKKYGLADPAWKLEIELAKEKRVLLLGNAEDKSKRLYASVQGAGAVFVIDEIDSTILARPRSAYLVEEKKVEPKKDPGKKQVLLLWHSPDGHPKDTHEYELGQKILKATLEKHAAVDAILVHADDPWKDGPELLAKADGVVLFISEGAKWLSADEKRLAAFRAAAKRGTGLAVLHWGMGTKDAKNIDAFVELFGGCHGGPDRKYKVVQTQATIADKSHPIMQGIADFKVRDEFYYTLKFAKSRMPLLNVAIDGEAHPVAWALQREGGGRSFGFSGLHFHENWQTPEYRRLVAQGVLWTLNLPIPKDGLEVK